MPVAVLIRISVVVLYVPVCLIAYWRLIPRLSPISKGLSTFMLAAQVLVTLLSLELNPDSAFERWLWHLDEESNIPSTLASTQLALVGFVTLLTALLAKAGPAWQRIYFIGFGTLFIHLARDEFLKFHENVPNWEIHFALLGAAVAVTTALVTLRLPRHLRIWNICILGGLAMSAAGAIVVEQLRFTIACRELGFFADGCHIYIVEESLEYLGVWLLLVGALGHLSDSVPRLGRLRHLFYVLPALWIAIHHAPYLIRLVQFNSPAAQAIVQYKSDVELRIYRLDKDQSKVSLQFFASPRTWKDYIGLGYSLHLVDQVSGSSIAGIDDSATRNHPMPYRLFGEREYVYKQWLQIDIPPTAPSNRAFWIVLTSWKQDDDQFTHQRVRSSDFPTLSDTQAILSELVIPADAEPAAAVPVASFANGLVLEGAGLPLQAKAGDTLNISFTWRSYQNGIDDLRQFLHVGDLASGEWWIYDQQPLGPRLPTRLWYSGLADSELWQVALPADLAPGRYSLFTGLYRTSDLERLPASAADGALIADARVPLGSLEIER